MAYIQTGRQSSCRVVPYGACARRFLIGFAPHGQLLTVLGPCVGPITRRAARSARSPGAGAGENVFADRSPRQLASRICVYCTGYDSMIFKARLLMDKAGYDRMNRRIDTTKRIALPIPTVDIVFAEGWVYRKSFGPSTI